MNTPSGYLCLPSWSASPPPPPPPSGWSSLPLWNFGRSSLPYSTAPPLNPRPSLSPCLIDWEYGLPKQAFPIWNSLLRTHSQPFDVVYGFDTGVNSPVFDEVPGLIAKKLIPYRVSFSYDFYFHDSEPLSDWTQRALFRARRLRDVAALTSIPSIALISPILQYTPDSPSASPTPVPPSSLSLLLSILRDHSLTPCIFAAATTVRARGVVDEAVARMASAWDNLA